MRLSMQVERGAAGLVRPHPDAAPAKLGTGAPPTPPSFVGLLNALASSEQSRARNEPTETVSDTEASMLDRPVSRTPLRSDASVRLLSGGSSRTSMSNAPVFSASPGGSMPQSAPGVPSGAPSAAAPSPDVTGPLAGPPPPAGVSLLTGTAFAQGAAALLTEALDATSEITDTLPRPTTQYPASWRPSAGTRLDRFKHNAPLPQCAPAEASGDGLLDVLARDAVAIRARLGADGTWHARFRTADHGLIAVSVAAGRDGGLTVTVRGSRSALGRLDADEMSSALGRPIHLSREPSDAPPT